MPAFNEERCLESFQKLLAIDSTTGQYQAVEAWTAEEIRRMGYEPILTHKGGVLADLGGEGDPLVVTAHLDDIGLMVRHINADGTLNVCNVGGLYPFYCVTENVRLQDAEFHPCDGGRAAERAAGFPHQCVRRTGRTRKMCRGHPETGD